MSYFIDAMFLSCGTAALYFGVIDLGVWDRVSPGGGFVPAFIGAFLMILSVLRLFGKHNTHVNFKFVSRMWLPPLAIVATLGVSYLVGMLPAIALMIFCWLKIVEKYPFWKTTQIVFIAVLLIYGIFRVWLKVLFPLGLLSTLF